MVDRNQVDEAYNSMSVHSLYLVSYNAWQQLTSYASFIHSSRQFVTLSRCVQEKEKRREELKRLKNLKKREILDKIEKLKDVTGDVAASFTEQDVEGEFNERDYDEMMRVSCFSASDIYVPIISQLMSVQKLDKSVFLFCKKCLRACSMISEFCEDGLMRGETDVLSVAGLGCCRRHLSN